LGDVATVAWSISGVKLSTPGLPGGLSVTVTGVKALCPFTLKNKHITPLLEIPGNS
jgi:hypothetical protein